MNVLKYAVAVSASVLATSAVSETIVACDYIASAANIEEPWENNTRTYANGDIRIALLNTGGEPVCCSNHLLIVSPNPEYGKGCHVLSDAEGYGFREVEFKAITSRYEPGTGIVLDVPVGDFDPDTGGVASRSRRVVRVQINQATGDVSLFSRAKSGLAKKVKN